MYHNSKSTHMTHWCYTGLEYVFQKLDLSGISVRVVSSGFNYVIAVTSDNQVYYLGNNSYVSRALHLTDQWTLLCVPFTAQHVTHVSAGWSHVIFLTVTGEVYTAGRNHVGQCGTGGTDMSHVTRLNLTGVIQCAAGDCHSLFLDEQGRVYGCGATQYGQLSNAIPNLDNHVLGDAVHTPQLLAEIPPMRGVAAGACHSLLIDYQGRAWSMGWNGYKQLGRTGSEHVIALVERFQLDDDTVIAAEVDHVIGALWSSIFVTRCRRVFVAGWCHMKSHEQVVHVTPYCIYESRARVAKNNLRVMAGRHHVLVIDGGHVHQFGLTEHRVADNADVLAATYFGAISTRRLILDNDEISLF